MKKYIPLALAFFLAASASADMFSVKDPSKVKKSGDTMNAGAELILSTHSPINPNAAISKAFADNAYGQVNFAYYLRDAASGLGDYKIMLSSPSTLTKSTTTVTSSGLNVFVSSWVTQSGEPTFNVIPAGMHNLFFRANLAAARDVRAYWKMLSVSSLGVVSVIDTSAEVAIADGTAEFLYTAPIVIDTSHNLASGSRLAIALFLNNYGSATDFNLYSQNETGTRVEFKTDVGAFDNRYILKSAETDPIYTSSAPATYFNKDGGATTQDYSLSANTMALWRFDEATGTSITDASANANNGTLSGTGYSWNTTSQKWGASALKFGGTNDWVNTTPLTGLARSSFTISVWLRIDANVSGTDTVISKAGTSTTKSWWLATNNNTNILNFSYSIDGNISSFAAGSSMNSSLPLGIWTMVTVTYDGTTTRYYMDDWMDKKVVQNLTGLVYDSATSSAAIGCLYSASGQTNFWAGHIDSLIIENGVWTSEKVREQFYAGGGKYNRLTNTVIPYKNYIVFETSSTLQGGDAVADVSNAKLGVWADHPGVFGTNFFVRAPYGRKRPLDPTIVAINVGTLNKSENGIMGEGGSVDLRWVASSPDSGYPAITWVGGGTLFLQGNTAVTSNLNIGNNVITQSSATLPIVGISTANVSARITSPIGLFDNVIAATTSLRTDLTAETTARIYADNLLGAATGYIDSVKLDKSSAAATYVYRSGDTMAGDFLVGNNVITQSSATLPIIAASTITANAVIVGGKKLSNFPEIGEVLTTRIALWSGSETTTISQSYVSKTFQTLCLGSTEYNLSTSTRTITFEVIGSSVTVELYNHTTGATVAGSEMTISATYASVPTTDNVGVVTIPVYSFPTNGNIISLRMKSTAGVTAKVAAAEIFMRYTR